MSDEGKVLLDASKEDILEFGSPFPTLSTDTIAWRVEESVVDPLNAAVQRLILRGYMFDTYFMKIIARVTLAEPHDIAWSPALYGTGTPPPVVHYAEGEK
ncbi:MAG: hypothetical protein QQN63_04320 [Nitrosopumilus sp.]